MLRLPLRAIPGSAVLPVLSGVNRGSRWVVGSSIHGCWLGHYEAQKQEAVRRLVRPGMKIFDVGANAGFYALAFARLAGGGGHVWAFEPLAENLGNLRRHVALNALANVTVVEAAVAERAGTARFAPGQSNSMGRLAAGGEIEVPTVTLDEFCAGAGFDCPDLIKFDIEGGEGAALRGASRVLARRKATILLALHGREQERICVPLLREAGYELRYLDGRPAGDPPLESDDIVAAPGA